MRDDIKRSIIFNILGSIAGWASFSLGIAAVASNTWVLSTDFRRSNGLWIACTRDVACQNIQEESWLLATRAFMILLVIFSSSGCTLNVISQIKIDKAMRKYSSVTYFIGGIFGMIGMAVYTGATRNTTLEFFYGPGYILGWFAAGLMLAADGFQWLSASNMCDAADSDEGGLGDRPVKSEETA